MDGAGSYPVAHRPGLLPTELTGMWGWILLRSPHQGRGSPPAPAPTQQRPFLVPAHFHACSRTYTLLCVRMNGVVGVFGFCKSFPVPHCGTVFQRDGVWMYAVPCLFVHWRAFVRA